MKGPGNPVSRLPSLRSLLASAPSTAAAPAGPLARGTGGHPTGPGLPAVLAVRPRRSAGRQPRTARPGARLPVILWMHGGAYSQGTGTQFGGRTMAELTGSVVVSINYRLGQLGYLALPELSRDNGLRSGSFGLMDQVEALRWTRENIAVRRRPGERHGLRPVRGQRLRLRAAGRPVGRRSLPPGRATERSVHPAGYAGPRGRGGARAVLRREGGVLRPGRGGRLSARRVRRGPDRGRPYAAHAGPGLRGRTAAGRARAGHRGSGAWNEVPVLIGSTRSEARSFVALRQPRLTAEEYAAQVLAG